MSCYKRVIEVLKDANKPMRLHQIHAEIRRRYKVAYETTAISAKIRSRCRQTLAKHGLTILSDRDGGLPVHVYWITKLPRSKR